MGFWPFGREPADVETASRVVTAPTRDSRRVRAKLTLYFMDPQTQTEADTVADRCAQLAEAVFQEVPGADHLLGNEQGIAAAVMQRLPPGLPGIRGIELAALHVVGDPGSVHRRRASTLPPPGAMGDVRLPMSAPPPSVPYPPPSVPTPPPSAPYPPPSAPYASPSGAAPPPSGPTPPGTLRSPPVSTSPRRRITSSSFRSVAPALIPPRGSPPGQIGASLAPLLRDAATRLLLGFLRTHDLVMVRRVPLDGAATELLGALLPVSEAPPGEFEASRAAEIAKWRTALGDPIMEALRAESADIAAFLARIALLQVGLAPGLTQEIVEALSAAAFPGVDARAWPPAPDPSTPEQELAADAARRAAAILGHPDPGQLEAALAPLVGSVMDDAMVLAQMAKLAVGLPA
jgi:hypothetical protein